eukprot:2348777-Rhodomonas_salina.3
MAPPPQPLLPGQIGRWQYKCAVRRQRVVVPGSTVRFAVRRQRMVLPDSTVLLLIFGTETAYTATSQYCSFDHV